MFPHQPPRPHPPTPPHHPPLPLPLVLTYTPLLPERGKEEKGQSGRKKKKKKKIRLISSENSGKAIPPSAALRFKMASVGDGATAEKE